MDIFAEALNDILVKASRNILRLEEESLKTISDTSLSINEMHLIECVGKGKDDGVTISQVASELCITRPSATIAVNKLEKKGYVRKFNCQEDGRVVYVVLTDKGREIDAIHMQYHKDMVNEVSKELDEDQIKYLIGAIHKLNSYFKKSIGEKGIRNDE
ncbi:MAG TPA: MarR family transcriptional regulator [Clostridiales bacterium]|nr:MarR family transcriptional regulator [Clostridiales bacterium]